MTFKLFWMRRRGVPRSGGIHARLVPLELAPLFERRVFSSTQQDETRALVSETLKEHRLTWKADGSTRA